LSTKDQVDPSSHSTVIAKYANAGASEVNTAIEAALKAKQSWEMLPFADRAAVFLKAADLISGKYRYEVMAATILGQGKNAWQAEIDAAAELCDFLRYERDKLYHTALILYTLGSIYNMLKSYIPNSQSITLQASGSKPQNPVYFNLNADIAQAASNTGR
jgi:delta 1-pyrroline-5-carboxylate dehydrogenase